MSIDRRSNAENLRHKAEALLKKKKSASALPLSEEAMLKLIQELEVHQIELELQNEELSLLNIQADALANGKYAELYKDALQENNSRLELAMQSANMAWWEMDVTTGSVTFGKRKAEMLGYSYEKFKHYTDFTALLHPEDYEKAMTAMRGHIEGLFDKYEVEYRILTQTGEYKWFYDIGSIVKRDLNGKPLSITGLVIDIDKRKQTDELLRKSEEKYCLLLENSGIGVGVYSLDGEIQFFNHKAIQNIGGKAEDYIGKSLKEVFGEQAASVYVKRIQETAKSEKSLEFEDFVSLASGSYWFLSNHTKIVGSDGKIIGVQVLAHDITDRKRSEQVIRDSERRFRAIFDQAPIGMALIDRKGFPIISNFPMSEMVGYTNDELSKMNFADFTYPEDADKDITFFNDLLEGRISEYRMEKRYVHKNGKLVWANLFVTILHGENGITQDIIGMAEDISERKLAEETLRNSEARLRTLLQTIPDLIWEKDSDGVYRGCNTMFERFFGAVEAEIVGKTDYDFVDRELAEFFRENDHKAMAAGKPTSNEEWITFADDGHRAFLETIKAPMYDAQNRLIGVLGIGRDMTERKIAEEARLESEIKYRAFFENSMDAILFTSPGGKTLSVNQAACNMFEYTEDELIKLGRSGVEDATDPRLSDLIADREIKGKAQGEVSLIRKDGTRFPAEISSAAFKNNDGLERASMIIRDITNRKKAENELIEAKNKAEESDRLKSAFLANMSHEIRTPMNGILGFAELLREPMLTGEEQLEYIDIIERSGTRMLNIINDIVNISKVESGQMEVSIKETNINEQIEYIYTFFKPEAKLKGIQLHIKISLPSNEANIRTDREKVYAILTNLVKNAIKFTHKGSIEFGYNLKAGRERAELEFFVKDTGVGINKGQHEFIFERFRQGSESLNRNYEGAGLGLTISKAYVEILGGKIWVESDPEDKSGGKGSTFYFTIPYYSELSGKKVSLNIESTDPYGFQINQKGSGLKILIVEDDEISEKLITAIVKIFSKELFKARTGVQAVEVCRNNPDIDLILMDIKIPGMDGMEATRQIRQFNRDVIIIAQSAFALTGDREEAIGAGCNDYLSKPIKKDELMVIIRKYFKK